jgi:methanogenic corrinoid protein MtbC1
MASKEELSELYGLILQARRTEANTLLSESIDRIGYEETLLELLEPTLDLVGDNWAKEAISLAQGFVAGKLVEDFLRLRQDLYRVDASDGRTVYMPTERTPANDAGASATPRKIAVLGNAEDDYHGLGRSMVASFLAIRHWTVMDLGCDIRAPDFIDAAVEAGACVIGVSAMMLTTARNIRKVREEIDRRGLGGRIKLAVGGAAFRLRPELVGEVGGDGTAGTAMEVPKLFDALRSRIGHPAGVSAP